MNVIFAIIRSNDLPRAVHHARAAATAAVTGDVSELDESTAALQQFASTTSSEVLSEAEWHSMTRLFGKAALHGELDFVIHGDALNHWVDAARKAGASALSALLEAARTGGDGVLQLPVGETHEHL